VGLLLTTSVLASGCSDPIMNSGVAHPGRQSGIQSGLPSESGSAPAVRDAGEIEPPRQDAAQQPDLPAAQAGVGPVQDQPAGLPDSARPREFSVDGSHGALRITFDDLDLMKLLNMDPVTSDCVEKMPAWLKGLDGKTVRVRGFMKPSGVTEGIPYFAFVRSTDLCCFGPKGKVYHLIAVKLKPGLTTEYIELKPFDVEGRFRIEKVELDEGLIFLLYHIDDAAIIRS
jgi:hypothetical protein